MSTIQEQLTHERNGIVAGIQRYNSTTDKAVQNGRGAETSFGSVLIKEYIIPVSEVIHDNVHNIIYNGGRRSGAFYKLLNVIAKVDHQLLAYNTLRILISGTALKGSAPLTSMLSKLGREVENEIRYSHFKDQHTELFDKIISESKRKKTQSARHMSRVLNHAQRQKGYVWEAWSTQDCVRIGAILTQAVMDVLDIFEIYNVTTGRQVSLKTASVQKTQATINVTSQALEWITKHKEVRELLQPVFSPMVVEPCNWTSLREGAYLTGDLRRRYSFVRGIRKDFHDEYSTEALAFTMEQVTRIQNTPWKVNTNVLDVAQRIWDQDMGLLLPHSEPLEIPPSQFADRPKEDLSEYELKLLQEWKMKARDTHNKESERKALCYSTASTLSVAERFKEQANIWFPMNTDNRGRVYSIVPTFNPQGDDLAKSLLCFGRGKPLGKDGWREMCIHGAGKYGYDKVSFADRVIWMENKYEEVAQLVSDPLRYTEFWTEADKPFQFLAFCFEFVEAYHNREEFVSHLAGALDGSCNGLQHFSAMLRDLVGGTATNLMPACVPADIYSDVARVCTRKLKESDISTKRMWLEFCDKHGDGQIPRKLAKVPVMTLPYGATRYGCTDTIHDYIMGTDHEVFGMDMVFGASKDLTDLLWDSISEVVVAARAIMDWLQKSAKKINASGQPIRWTTPTGFPVIQANYKVHKPVRIMTVLGKRLSVSEESSELSGNKQQSSISPNFVHSMDSSHMLLTIKYAYDKGIEDFACIHDDYGTHFCNVPTLHKCIREAFVDMYTNHDPVKDFYETYKDHIDEPPEYGSLVIDFVKDSPYFFG